MGKKNVAIIVQKLRGGGAERTASNLSICLSKEYNVHLIVFDGSDMKYPYAGTLHDLKLPPIKSKFGKIVNVYKRIKAVKAIKKKEKIDVSISLMDNANYINVFSKVNDRVIVSIRNQMTKRVGNSKRALLQLNQVIKRMDCLVSLSEGVKKDLVDHFSVPSDRIVTIYNPCDAELLVNEAAKHLDATKDMGANSIITMGRLIEQKGQWHLIRAFAEAKKEVSDAELYILGEGKLRDKLAVLASELQVEKSVHFMGFVEAPHAYIRNSRCFVFPSLFEGLGNVLLEAMAFGTPCIASDCFSGPREILAPGTQVKEKMSSIEYAEYGILTSVGDEEHFDSSEKLTDAEVQLAESMIELLKDDVLNEKYSRKAIERSRDFLPEVITKQWISLIENI